MKDGQLLVVRRGQVTQLVHVPQKQHSATSKLKPQGYVELALCHARLPLLVVELEKVEVAVNVAPGYCPSNQEA